MAAKIGYFFTSVFVLVFILLHRPNFCHSAEEDSQCLCPDSHLSKKSVKGTNGSAIPFVIPSYGNWGRRRTFISGISMNSLLVAAATVLYGSTVAVFAFLCLKSLKFSGLQMNLLESIFNPSAMEYAFDESDHIMSRRRIRARQNHQLTAR